MSLYSFTSRPFVFHPLLPMLFKDLPDTKWNYGFPGLPAEILQPLTRWSSSLLVPGRLFSSALATLQPHLLSVWSSTLFTPCLRFNSSPSRQGTAFSRLDHLPFHHLVIWTDGCVFLIGKEGSGFLDNCSPCVPETTLFCLAGPVFC